METKGISVIIPAWGPLSVVHTSVLSVVRQWAPSTDKYPKFECVIVDDWIEGRNADGSSPYEYYLSDEFKSFYDPERVSIKLILNEEHKYQGESREIGFNAAQYEYFCLLDCDDMLAPNACYRYWEAINKESTNKPVACCYGLLYSFDKNDYANVIEGKSIWVQARCFNRRFIHHNEIHFPTGLGSRQGEDYPFMRCFDYAYRHSPGWQVIEFNKETSERHAYWFPNYNSLSRKDPHYAQHLAGWTAYSSLRILEYEKWFMSENGFTIQDDEAYKIDVLNMNCYTMYNVLDFLCNVSMDTEWEPLKEDWEALRDAAIKIREKILPLWDEYNYSDIYDMMYQVKHMSDVHFTESWLGTIFDYVSDLIEPLKYSYEEMIDYCRNKISFDYTNRLMVDSKAVRSFADRHKTMKLLPIDSHAN